MSFRINVSGECWENGVFCVPKSVAENSINFADEIKIKVLLLVLSEGKAADVETIASRLKISKEEAEEALGFWANEDILYDSEDTAPPEKSAESPAPKAFEALPVPSLTPKDIVKICSENPELAELLRSSERALKSTLSASMKSNIINMATYYGLPVPVIITLLEYYKTERDKGKSITTRTLQNMAKEWANEGVSSLEEASLKLQQLKDAGELWGNVISLCELDFRKPTSAQMKMLSRWMADFDDEMIFFACNTMKKYTDEEKRSLKAVDNILKEWKRKGFKTPDDVKAKPAEREKKNDKKLKRKPSFDIDKIAKKAKLNDNYDI